MKNLKSTQWLITHLLTTAMVAGLVARNLSANEAVETVAAKKTDQTVTNTQISKWIKELDSDDPETRLQAASQLEKNGSVAIDALTEAADTKNLHLSTQCIEILKSLHESGKGSQKKLAKGGLTKLSESNNPKVAQRAVDAIKSSNPAPVPQNRFRLGGIQLQAIRKALQNRQNNNQKERKNVVKEGNKIIEVRETPGQEIIVKVTEKVNGKDKVTETKAKNLIELRKKNKDAYDMYRKHKPKAPARPANPFGNIAGGNIQIIMNGGARNMKMQQTNNNGQRHTEVEENGRKIEIDDLNNTNIVVKITEKVNGKEKTSEYKAKDLKELKKKHPKAAQEYEKHIKGEGAIQLRIIGGAGKVLPNVKPLPIQNQKDQQKGFRKMQQERKEILENIKEEIERRRTFTCTPFITIK